MVRSLLSARRRRAFALSSFLVVALFAGSVFGVSTPVWPGFRGPNGSGIADGADLPATWDPASGSNIRWAAEVPGLAHSSPVVAGDRVYLTTAVAQGMEPGLTLGDSNVAGIAVADDRVTHRWVLMALDLATGDLVWETLAHEGEPRVGRHVKASHASQTPATNGEVIVAMMGSEGLFAFDLDGELLWSTDVGTLDPGFWGEPEIQWGPASSPVIWEDLVFVQNDRQADSFMVAYELATGREVWRRARDEKPAWSTPVLWHGERTELIANGANVIRSYDPRTGEELWTMSHGDREVLTPSPVLAGDTLVVTGGYPTGGNPITAMVPGGSGTIAPTPESEQVLWTASPGSPYTPTPLIYRDRLWVIVDNGILSVYDLASGDRLHRSRMAVGAGFSASPVAADGRIYFPSEDGDLFVLSADDYSELARIDMGEPLMASPAIADGALIVRGRHHVWAISER